ncbi:MAG: hypothetical protein U5P41_05315 [Gammaproteobacteria bacterium]|nr:hypothetical protein [Gammaproteobacteria bacterium]
MVDHNRRFLGVLHQSSLNKALGHLNQHGKNDNALSETALALSELIWDACAGIFSGVSDTGMQWSEINGRRQMNDDADNP